MTKDEIINGLEDALNERDAILVKLEKEHKAAVAEKDAEIARLREALIRCGRAAGAYLADMVSTEFLMLVPSEVEAKIQALSNPSSGG